MKKNTFLLAFITLIATTVFTSCEKEKEFVEPVVKGIYIAPNPCHVGDTVLVMLTYENIGAYWYYTKQDLTMDGESWKSMVKPDGGALDPYINTHVVVTKEGTHNVTFTSQISIYTGKNNPFADGPTASASLIVMPKEDKPTEDTSN